LSLKLNRIAEQKGIKTYTNKNKGISRLAEKGAP